MKKRRQQDDGRSLFDEVEDDLDSGRVANLDGDSRASTLTVDCGVADGELAYQLPVEQSDAGSNPAGHPRVSDEWREVPQALFLSWSPAMQYAYCAERDLRASIEYATSPEEERWFYERAVSYTRMKEAATTRS